MNEDPFKEYLKESEPDKRDKGYAWHTAIGLQMIDGLKPSDYLLRTAVRNIEGEITLQDANALLQTYYAENPDRKDDDRTEEADKVSARIAMLLSQKAFTFSPNAFLGIHKILFSDIYPHAGHFRNYNITKKEWVLNGETVLFGNAPELRETLKYDFEEERKFSYRGLTTDEIIHHLAVFISRLWQIHVFGEGNTRTTAVFLIKYLHKMGFDVTNDVFAGNAWYFRNALVRANYSNLRTGIHETTEYLELFLRNLLLDEQHPLHNRTMHISGIFKGSSEPDIGNQKVDIEGAKPDIRNQKVDIDATKRVHAKTEDHIIKLREAFPAPSIFGRTDVMAAVNLKPSRASELLRAMLEREIIEPIAGKGKGKYRFSENRGIGKTDVRCLRNSAVDT